MSGDPVQTGRCREGGGGVTQAGREPDRETKEVRQRRSEGQ